MSGGHVDLLGWDKGVLLQSCIDAITDPCFVKDRQHNWVAFNAAFVAMMGQSRETLIGKSDYAFVPEEQAAAFWRDDDEVFRTGVSSTVEEAFSHPDGTVHIFWTRKFPLRDESGEIVGLVCSIVDITDLHRRREEVRSLEQQVSNQLLLIHEQNTLLDQLGVPIIEVHDGIVLLPLVGNIDARRAQLVMERMLEGITSRQAEYVIIDISGVAMVDTHVAGSLLRAVQASRLLGCETILVGISPEIAQTMVQLGIDFGAITTYASLKQGLVALLGR